MPNRGTITLICCGNCAHDFGKEYRKALKELKRTGCFIEEMTDEDVYAVM